MSGEGDTLETCFSFSTIPTVDTGFSASCVCLTRGPHEYRLHPPVGDI